MVNQKKKQMRRNKIIALLVLLIVFIIYSCGLNTDNNTNVDIKKESILNEPNCKLINKVFLQPMCTKLNLNLYDILLLEYYKKKDGKFIKVNSKKPRVYKNYDKQLKTWTFDVYDSLDINMNYNFIFISKSDSIKYYISNLRIGENAVYANGKYNKFCSLLEYSINGVMIKGSNFYFE